MAQPSCHLLLSAPICRDEFAGLQVAGGSAKIAVHIGSLWPGGRGANRTAGNEWKVCVTEFWLS